MKILTRETGVSGERYTTKLGNSFKRLGGCAEIFIKKCRKSYFSEIGVERSCYEPYEEMPAYGNRKGQW